MHRGGLIALLNSRPEFTTSGQEIPNDRSHGKPVPAFRSCRSLHGCHLACRPPAKTHHPPPLIRPRRLRVAPSSDTPWQACSDDGRTRLVFPRAGNPRPSPHCVLEFPREFSLGRFLRRNNPAPLTALLFRFPENVRLWNWWRHGRSQGVPDKLSLSLGISPSWPVFLNIS